VQILPKEIVALNGICPYFTMFPLDFPYGILNKYASKGDLVADPFCGRGTSMVAAHLLGLGSIGIDSNPVAVAISQAKLVRSSPNRIMKTAQSILQSIKHPSSVPYGEFWEWAFHSEVLQIVCRLRDGLIQDCRSNARKALRAIILGAMHGPIQKTKRSYFSNQCPRTYSPKPRYSVKFWKENHLKPENVNVLEIIEERAKRYYGTRDETASYSMVVEGDCRKELTYSRIRSETQVNWIITSPPYYGMRTYVSDQWLRYWFVGGDSVVDYRFPNQMAHSSMGRFTEELRRVWKNLRSICACDATLVVRFGAINDRKVDPVMLIKESLRDSGWKYKRSRSAGYASEGKRQILHFGRKPGCALEEYDIWASVG